MSVEDVVRQVLVGHGIMNSARVEQVPQQGKQPSFEAFTLLKSGVTTLRYNPDFKIPKRAKGFAWKHGVADALHTCARDVTGHECGHIHNSKRVACPGNIDEHVEHFYEPISSVLAKKGKLGAVNCVTNLVEDLIDNTLYSKGSHAGLTIFYEDVADTIGWEPLYDAYMRIQLYSWGNTHDKRLLAGHFKDDAEVKDATLKFLRRIERLSGKNARMSHDECADYFADKDNWKKIAREFTKALEPLIPENPESPMCGFGKQMAKEMADPAKRGRFARKNFDSGGERPSWMGQEEALDAVYSSLAREISIKVEEPRKATSLPIVPIRHMPFDPEEHSFSKINFRKPMFVAEKETPFGIEALTFGVPANYIEKPLMVKKGMTNFPEFKCAYLDCSYSMQEGLPDKSNAGSKKFIPWGDRSKYHHLCRSWYNIIEYLARQQILPNVDVTLATFSDKSHIARGLSEAKKLLLNPHWGATNMSPRAVSSMLDCGKSVFFTVSDGEIANWDDVKTRFVSKAKEHYYFHIQLGKRTEMTRDLERAGLDVYYVKKGEDLERLAIDLTHNAYKTYIDESMARMR